MAKKKNLRQPEKLSLVIPAYKADKIIYNHLLRVCSVLDKLPYNYEVICVEDGKIDETRKEIERAAKKNKNIIATGYLTNLGKGHAVRFGMAQAKGDIIGYMDAGYEINPDVIPLLLEHLNWYKADAIIASKRHPASKVNYPWQRRILSFGYQMTVRLLFGLKVRDTQVGLKFFRREVLEKVLPRLLVKEFAFDIEILSVANKLGYKKIYEAPVEMRMEFGGGSAIVSKGFLKTVFKMMQDTAAVFYRLRLLNYYDWKNRKNWVTPEYLKFHSRS